MPAGFEGENAPAEILLDHSDRFVYASNRGPGTIAVFARDQGNGHLKQIQIASTGGTWPRGVVFDPSGRFLFAGDQKSNKFVIFEVDPRTGKLTLSGKPLDVPSPVSFVFVPANASQRAHTEEEHKTWATYGGNAEDIRYSSLKQINRSNVARLQTAWTYETNDGPGGSETQPIIVNGTLYGITPRHKVVALDAGTGKLVWRFDSGIVGRGPNRGLTYWGSGDDRRIFAAVQSYLYALDAVTGNPIDSFGQHGRVDLREGLGRDPAQQSVILTTPGIVYKDLLIVGDRTPEELPAPPGDIRAYDVRTGAIRWSFHTIPRPGEPGYETWPKDAWTYTGAANNWAGMALDIARGIVFVPTGSAASDFYGADRLGDDLFANCLLALNASTGERIWYFQGVKHDIWDRDFPSPPSLVTVVRDGNPVDAVAQTTKNGYVYLFNRVSGQALFPIEYRCYPASTVPGETSSMTQPLPAKPTPFARQRLTASLITNRTSEVHERVLDRFRNLYQRWTVRSVLSR